MKTGDKCGYCGNEWVSSPDGKGIWHTCMIRSPSEVSPLKEEREIEDDLINLVIRWAAIYQANDDDLLNACEQELVSMVERFLNLDDARAAFSTSTGES